MSFKMLNNKKGFFGIQRVAILFLELVVFVAFLPAINSFIDTALPYLSGNVMAEWIIRLIPLATVIGITMFGFTGGNPEYRR